MKYLLIHVYYYDSNIESEPCVKGGLRLSKLFTIKADNLLGTHCSKTLR